LPSASQIDQEDRPSLAELVPKVVFRWKRDGRLSKDMTCYMTGRNVGGKKSKEPDITVAFFRAKHDSTLTIYEPNMARVEIEDRRGLEIALLMSAETIKDLYLSPSQDPFHILASNGRRRQNSRPPANSSGGPTMAGALNNNRPSSPPRAQAAAQPSNNNAQRQAEIDAETKRLQAMVAEEERKRLEREQAEEEERKRLSRRRNDYVGNLAWLVRISRTNQTQAQTMVTHHHHCPLDLILPQAHCPRDPAAADQHIMVNHSQPFHRRLHKLNPVLARAERSVMA
jgi:hypothetical protein